MDEDTANSTAGMEETGDNGEEERIEASTYGSMPAELFHCVGDQRTGKKQERGPASEPEASSAVPATAE